MTEDDKKQSKEKEDADKEDWEVIEKDKKKPD